MAATAMVKQEMVPLQDVRFKVAKAADTRAPFRQPSCYLKLWMPLLAAYLSLLLVVSSTVVALSLLSPMALLASRWVHASC